ncbi:hypothetical protein ACIOMM_36465 [Streptomyces sp. NPDC087908]|uniref:hypothetical protein n=1 Tax=Streptomyces sp. NPDC087908 TaxID=3365820 RepID=UPI0037FF3344
MLTPASDIHHASVEHGIMLLDVHTAKWSMLSPDVSRIWQAIVTNGTTEWPRRRARDPHRRDPYAARQGIDNLVNQVEAGEAPHRSPAAGGAPDAPDGPFPDIPTLHEQTVAAVGLALSLTLSRLQHKHRIAAVRTMRHFPAARRGQ